MGELISLFVAICWTATALFADVASHRVGAGVLNVWRMVLAVPMLSLTLWFLTGSFYPQGTDCAVWMWLLASGFVGYVFGDFCLFNAYLRIGSRFAQLFMTLASPFAAIAAYLIMGEEMTLRALLGMVITISGIGMSIMGRGEQSEGKKKRQLLLPMTGVLLGIGAGLGQGVGLVLSKHGMELWQQMLDSEAVSVSSQSGWIPMLAMAFGATFIRGIMGLIGFTATMFFRHEHHGFFLPLQSVTNAFTTLMSVVLGPFVGVSLSLLAVSMTNAGVAQTLMSLTPVFIIWPSRFLFGGRIRPVEVIGAIIAVGGAILFFV